MLYKNKKVKDGYINPHKKLAELLRYAEGWCMGMFNKSVFMTGSKRTHQDSIHLYPNIAPGKVPYSVHETSPLRGADLRAGNKSAYALTEAEARLFEEHMNQRWQYDPKRPKKKVVLFHSVKGNHLHLQVSDSTIMLEEI